MTDTPTRTPDPAVRIGIVVITLAALAVSVAIVYFSAMSAIETWLEYRWIPIATGVFALAVGVVCLWVLKRLTGYKVS